MKLNDDKDAINLPLRHAQVWPILRADDALPALLAERVHSHRSERSFLDAPAADGSPAFTVGGRTRYATCSGAAWFRGHHLAVVNLYGHNLRIYRFDPSGSGSANLTLLHELTEDISYPDNIAVSPDGCWLATTHTARGGGTLSLRRIDPVTLAPERDATILRTAGEGCFQYHGVGFSADSRHLAVTAFGDPGHVEVIDMVSPGRPTTCRLANRHSPQNFKSVAFSRDGRFAVLCAARPVDPAQSGPAEPVSASTLSLHPYAGDKGIIAADAVAEFHTSGQPWDTVELCDVLPRQAGRPYRIAATCQAGDVVTVYDFDPDAGRITLAGHCMRDVSFPHGIGISPDGRFAAVTAYGDDTLHILRFNSQVLETD